MDDDVTTTLRTIGPRLRSLRQQQDRTLEQVAEATGISVSTLSRLESGQRRPLLEHLLPLARTYRVPLDELVDTPTAPDPRVRTRPLTRHGRTFYPLTRSHGTPQAYKIVIPAPSADRAAAAPELQVHTGYEWLYVLSGRLRLQLGEHDLLLDAGEAAEFDTRVPHALSSAGPGPVELLTLFGPDGERMHVRARPSGR
ncbi:MAG TPA: XRE family transcriptional regulator [Euzebyales bacterium]